MLKKIHSLLLLFGVSPLKMLQSLKRYPLFLNNLRILKKESSLSDLDFPFGENLICLSDFFDNSGVAKGHYFHQDLLIAQRIFHKNPDRHVDIGSRIDGFVAHVGAFRKIEVFDIRGLDCTITNIKFKKADLMAHISDDMIDYCDSVSSLHAIEHFGLGRYGDPVQFDGFRVGLENIFKILKKNGVFYFSVPIGPQRIEYNAHRVFSVEYLLSLFLTKYRIENFSYVDDSGDLHQNVPLEKSDIETSFDCQYGCGIFEMTKL